MNVQENCKLNMKFSKLIESQPIENGPLWSSNHLREEMFRTLRPAIRKFDDTGLILNGASVQK